ncbi:MAG: GNAT family N-acetyltransferase [Aquihabitans sp.]
MPRIVTWSEADGPVAAHAARLRAEHGGEVVDVQDGPLSSALLDAGATVGRRSYLMSLAPLPDSLDAGPFAGSDGPMRMDSWRYAGALLRAFPPDHADYDPAIADEPGAERAMVSYFNGSVIGPFLPASCEAADASGRVLGGLVVNRMPEHDDSPGGPWVTEVFVEPDAQGQGIGRALFAATVMALRTTGERSLRLAVHRDNPAQHLYTSLGFTQTSAWSRITL